LPLLDFPFVANRLQRGDAGYVYRSCLFKCHIRRFQRDCPVRVTLLEQTARMAAATAGISPRQ